MEMGVQYQIIQKTASSLEIDDQECASTKRPECIEREQTRLGSLECILEDGLKYMNHARFATKVTASLTQQCVEWFLRLCSPEFLTQNRRLGRWASCLCSSQRHCRRSWTPSGGPTHDC